MKQKFFGLLIALIGMAFVGNAQNYYPNNGYNNRHNYNRQNYRNNHHHCDRHCSEHAYAGRYREHRYRERRRANYCAPPPVAYNRPMYRHRPRVRVQVGF